LIGVLFSCLVCVTSPLSGAENAWIMREDFSQWPDFDAPGVGPEWEAVGQHANYFRSHDSMGISATFPDPEESTGFARRYLVKRSLELPPGTMGVAVDFRIKPGFYMAPLFILGRDIEAGFIEGVGFTLTGSSKPADEVKVDLLAFEGNIVTGLAEDEPWTDEKAGTLRLARPSTGIVVNEIHSNQWQDFRWELRQSGNEVQMRLIHAGGSEPLIEASFPDTLFHGASLFVGFGFSAIGNSSPGIEYIDIQALPKE